MRGNVKLGSLGFLIVLAVQIFLCLIFIGIIAALSILNIVVVVVIIIIIIIVKCYQMKSKITFISGNKARVTNTRKERSDNTGTKNQTIKLKKTSSSSSSSGC